MYLYVCRIRNVYICTFGLTTQCLSVKVCCYILFRTETMSNSSSYLQCKVLYMLHQVVGIMNTLIDISVQCESFIYWCRSVFLSISHICISVSEEEKTNIRMFGRRRSYGERKQEKVMNRCEYLSSSYTYPLSAFKIRTNVFPFFLALLNSLALQKCSYLESRSGLFLPFLRRRMRSWFYASNR